MKKIKKKKAFIGAIIEGVKDITGTISGVINAKRQADANRAEYERQQGEIYANEALQLGNVLTQEANSQGYVDQMKKRISFKMGGKKIKKKKCAVGGNVYGGSQVFGQTGNEYAGVANAGITGATVSAIIGAFNPTETLTLKHNAAVQAQAPKVIKDPIQPIVPQQPQMINQNPILAQAKLGCKRIKKRNTNRFK